MLSIVYDTILSAIHNYILALSSDVLIVYDTILSAIHNRENPSLSRRSIVYDTILSAIHNVALDGPRSWKIVYDTILSAIHNSLKACGLPEVVVYDFSAMSKNDVAKISIIIEFAKNRYTF